MDAFAPACAAHRLVPVLDNIAIARDTYRLRLGDAAMAQAIKPGQFVMIRPGPEGATDPLLGRPLALYEVVRDSTGNPTAFDVVYLVVGRGTAALSQRRPGERIAVWGQLGIGFGPPPAGPVILVAGGIGPEHRSWHWAAGELGQASYGNEPTSKVRGGGGKKKPPRFPCHGCRRIEPTNWVFLFRDHHALWCADRRASGRRRRLPACRHRSRASN